jgi:hypothetical protein
MAESFDDFRTLATAVDWRTTRCRTESDRLLSRSHRRLTDDQKVKVFPSLIKETRITASGVEFEMYVQPTQNAWWKYRQKKYATTLRLRTHSIPTIGIHKESGGRGGGAATPATLR